MRERFWPLFIAIAGALPFAVAHLAYQLGLLITSQAGLVRTLGVLAVFSLALAGLAALLALIAIGLGLDRRLAAWRPWGQAGFTVVAIASLINLGLCVFYWSPKLAPLPYKLGAVVALVAVAAAVVRQSSQERALAARTFSRLGLAALVGPWLAMPWVVHGALGDQPRIPQSPLPPVQPRLRADAPKRIVLVTFDALRARSTSVQTPGLGTTPTLEAIAREGAYFTNCHSVADQTVVSMASVLSGIRPMPLLKKVQNRLGYQREGTVTGLAGYLAAAGYRSYYATMLIDPSVFGMAKEFVGGTYNARIMMPSAFNTASYLPVAEAAHWLAGKLTGHEQDDVYEQQRLRAARQTLAEARRCLQRSPERTFMWVHMGLPHDQYYSVPPEADDGVHLNPWICERLDLKELKSDDPATLKHYERVYEDYIRFGDHELGRFVAGLKQDGLWDDTMVVVVSDHGEQFLPGQAGHGFGSLTEDAVHVPLLVRVPHQRPLRSNAPVTHLDVAPTILAQVFADPLALEGRSLLGASMPTNRVVFSNGLYAKQVLGQDGPWNYAAFMDRFKYRVDLATHEEGLFDYAADPLDQNNLAARYPEMVHQLRELVEKRLKS